MSCWVAAARARNQGRGAAPGCSSSPDACTSGLHALVADALPTSCDRFVARAATARLLSKPHRGGCSRLLSGGRGRWIDGVPVRARSPGTLLTAGQTQERVLIREHGGTGCRS
eukprot:scaffold888_cov569-Prasinococcus_capsulatus_cf.AAC.22